MPWRWAAPLPIRAPSRSQRPSRPILTPTTAFFPSTPTCPTWPALASRISGHPRRPQDVLRRCRGGHSRPGLHHRCSARCRRPPTSYSHPPRRRLRCWLVAAPLRPSTTQPHTRTPARLGLPARSAYRSAPTHPPPSNPPPPPSPPNAPKFIPAKRMRAGLAQHAPMATRLSVHL